MLTVGHIALYAGAHLGPLRQPCRAAPTLRRCVTAEVSRIHSVTAQPRERLRIPFLDPDCLKLCRIELHFCILRFWCTKIPMEMRSILMKYTDIIELPVSNVLSNNCVESDKMGRTLVELHCFVAMFSLVSNLCVKNLYFYIGTHHGDALHRVEANFKISVLVSSQRL